MTAVVVADIGENLIALTDDAMPIGYMEELVACSKRRHIVGVTGNVSESVGHSDRGKRRRSC